MIKKNKFYRLFQIAIGFCLAFFLFLMANNCSSPASHPENNSGDPAASAHDHEHDHTGENQLCIYIDDVSS